MAAVHEPTRSMRGRSDSEVWFFAEDAGRRCPWLQVVVHYVVTAFPRATLPR